MEIKPIEFFVDGSKLEGTMYQVESSKVALLILGGGSNITHNESYYPSWQQLLSENGISSLTFDFRGVGNSDLELEETSLYSRLSDAKKAVSVLRSEIGSDRLYIAGVSMGVPITIRLTKLVNPDGIILISPAAYAEESWDKNFGPTFSGVIRRERSWENSRDFDELENFRGQVLLAYGKDDEVVPHPILERYVTVTNRKNGVVLAFDNCGHRFMRDENQPSEEGRKVFYNELLKMLKDS